MNQATLHKLEMVLLFKQYNLLMSRVLYLSVYWCVTDKVTLFLNAIGLKHVPMKILYIFMFK